MRIECYGMRSIALFCTQTMYHKANTSTKKKLATMPFTCTSFLISLLLSLSLATSPPSPQLTTSCPCISSNQTLAFFTSQNTDPIRSCQNQTISSNNIGIWLKRELQGGWHPFGFHVYFHNDTDGGIGIGGIKYSCLMEGDIMVRIDNEDDALECQKFIMNRCIEIGLFYEV